MTFSRGTVMAQFARALFSAWLAAIVLVSAAVPAGAASPLDDYRAQGVIAERFDGLVEVRDGVTNADAARLVEEVNAKRMAIYKERAAKQDVPVSEVGKIYALEIADKAPDGTYFRKPDGSYIQK